jgi:acetylornithine deacetylase
VDDVRFRGFVYVISPVDLFVPGSNQTGVSFDPCEFHRQAIDTPSHDDIDPMRTLLIDTLEREGYSPTVDEAGNVRAVRGTDGGDGTHLVLNTHLDTVPPHRSYERDGDIVRGRGACDAKGPLAAMLEAFLTAPIAEGTGQLTLAVTPDEETAQTGGAHLGVTLPADGYIVGEPTGLDVCPAARGNFGGEVTLYGERGHASKPAAVTNPILGVGPLLEALSQYDECCGPDNHEVLGQPTLAPTRIDGGDQLSQISATCTVGFDRRTVPPETIDEFLNGLRSHLAEWLPEAYEFDVHPAYPDSPSPDAFVTDRDADLVQMLAAASGGEIRPFEAATEASYLAANAPTVVFGPGVLVDEHGPVAHADREYISRASIATAADILSRTVEKAL